MKKFASAAARSTPIIADPSSRPIRRKGLLARIVQALHGSRRIEARRVIHRYRHLIAEESYERPKFAAVNPCTTEESNADADRDNARVYTGRRALQDA
jgi:hypothetical protein